MSTEKQVNVIDFDYTIYDGDCSLDFYFYCIKRQPVVIFYLPEQVLHYLLMKLGFESRDSFKTKFFSFLKSVNNLDATLADFWLVKYPKVKQWYIDIKSSQDVIISASPYFLLEPAAQKLGVKKLIATNMDPRTGTILGKNCRGQEKVDRLYKELGDVRILRAYSDSLIDLPILAIAQESFIVKGSTISQR